MTHTDALLLLQIFRRRALPTLLRRLHMWKGLDRDQHHDLLEDLQQDLILDCLENPDVVVSLSSRDRHTRWFRLIERNHYQLHLRANRQRASSEQINYLEDGGTGQDARVEAELGPVDAWGEDLPQPERRLLRRLSSSARYLKNGRLNCRASAQSLAMRPRDLTEAWCRVAEDLGYGDEFLAFWRRRLVEALLGLAADLLRDSGAIVIHDEDRRRRPDPTGRLRRIGQLKNHLSCRPLPHEIKSVLARYPRTVRGRTLRPLEILADAAALQPDNATVHLWIFEAALAQEDLPAAAAAIRAARGCRAAPVPVILARARLLEVRGRRAAARHLLCKNRGSDRKVRHALQNLAG